ncbi:YegP family protein [Cellulophaga sp. 20_2_10]|uniref:YegP family protein n=1 Tax=Cellulophaga sp. 20_2_10 TaxID=2942476 RepID=UPI00201A30CE|nr:YegP family protein [Cellulophaga sp. 20_2_10]MCL5246505.1 YegP family protein [Cellulophaga sp. 20_2_10]
MTKPYYEVKKTITNRFYFNLKTSEDEILLYGETCKTLNQCKQQIIFIKQNAYDYDCYQSKITKTNRYYFNLLQKEDIILGQSNKHNTLEEKELAIASVMLYATVATIKIFNEAE